MTTDSRFDGPGPDETWRLDLAQGKFSIQHCGRCGSAQFPPTVACRRCGSAQLSFIEADGRGTVYSTTFVRSRDGGHNVSLVDLFEGPRMMSRVEGVSPEAVRIGMTVRARIVPGDPPMVVFDAEETR